MEFTFNDEGDYKAEFSNYVDLLFKKVATTKRDKRIKLTDGLTESYIRVVGEAPAGVQLSRLATFILYDELEGNRDPHKASKTGLLSDRQLRTRKEEKEVDGRIIEIYGSDGRNYV